MHNCAYALQLVLVLGTEIGSRFGYLFWVSFRMQNCACALQLVLVLGTESGPRRGYLCWFQACSRWFFTYQRTMGTDLGTHFEHPFWFQIEEHVFVFLRIFCIILHAFRASTHVLLTQRPVRIHSNLARTIDLVRYVEPRGHHSEQPRLHMNLGAETCS